ncbi:MAG TPA: CoA-transferase [Verrucomicrobiae bacterium]|jgi:glutaconate CoA-transferase subunit A|nr:CoA-transferase [Verrucomicrobiae bacterium]
MSALQAGVMNVPFVPVRGLLGTDYLTVRPDFHVVPNPYDPQEPIVIVPAVAPDVAVFHGWKGDRHGNVVTSGTLDAKLIAQASRRTIATVEEIVDGDLTQEPHTGVLVPGIHVSAVVHAPRGAHPTSCEGRYPVDDPHVREYVEAAQDDDTFVKWLDRYVYGVPDHAGYLERVGLAGAAR